MKKAMSIIDYILYWILVVLMLVMVLTVTWQVFTRYVLGASSAYTEELSTFLLIWITLLGAAYAIRKKAHLGIDILTRKMNDKNHKRSRYFVFGIIIVFSIFILIVGGLQLINITFMTDQFSAALRIPMGYIYLILPLSGLLMIFYSVAAIMDLRSAKREEFEEFVEKEKETTLTE